MKKRTITAAIILSTMPLAHASEPTSDLRYDYIEIGAGKGGTKFSALNRTFEYRTKTYEANVSKKLTNQTYMAAGVIKSTTHDSDSDQGISIKLDDTDLQATATFGFIIPLRSTIDIIAEAGAAHSNSTSTFLYKPGYVSEKSSDKKTKLLFKAGLRSIWFNAFEVNASVIKSGKLKGYELSGPIHITQNMALDIKYNYTNNYDTDRKNKSSVLSAAIRYHF